MVACILLAALLLFVPYLSDNRWHYQYHPIFFIEFIAAWAFGWAWFVKGQRYCKLKAAIQRRPSIPRQVGSNRTASRTGAVTGATNKASSDSATWSHPEPAATITGAALRAP